MDYRSALALKNVTLINGRADDGGAIRTRSRMPPGQSAMAMGAAEAARLEIRGGAIRNCEATNNGGALGTLTEATMFGGASRLRPLGPALLSVFGSLGWPKHVRAHSHNALHCPRPPQVSTST